MHILIIPSEPYIPEEAPILGIFQQHQAKALANAGHQVGILSPKGKSLKLLRNIFNKPTRTLPEDSEKIKISVLKYAGWNLFPKIPYAEMIQIVGKGMRLYHSYVKKNGAPDIIHAHNCLYSGILALRLKKKTGIPYILTEHSSAYGRGFIKSWHNAYIIDVLKKCSKFTVVGSRLGELLHRRFGELAKSYTPIYNILEDLFEKQNLIPGSAYKPPEPFVFLNIASLDQNKNHELLIRAFASQFYGMSHVRLKIGGNGPLAQHLEKFAHALKIHTQISFLGPLNREQVVREVRQCNAFALSSDLETFGVVLIEAMACGKPVISTLCGGPEDIVNKINGLLVPGNNVAILGNAMRQLYNTINSYDPVRIRQDCVERFGEKTFLRRLLAIYGEALGKKC